MTDLREGRARIASLRRLEASDLSPVESLLDGLPRDYPGARAWLARRLRDALAGRAECWTAKWGDSLAGVAILTPKSDALKLSTIYVSDKYRGLGFGSLLLDRTIERAASLGLTETYVTVAEQTVPLLRPLLDSRGFTPTAFERHRYGRGRHEAVFTRLDS